MGALIASLQFHYQASEFLDPLARSICTVAVTKLIKHNKGLIDGREELVTVWNIFFAWDSMLERCTPDRLTMIECIGELVDLVVQHDHGLTKRILEDLLCMGQRSVNEKQTSRKVLTRMFSLLIRKNATENSDLIFDLFLSLLNPYNESNYDLLDWAIRAVLDVVKSKEIPKPLVRFTDFLLEHLSSQHETVRFGAGISLNAVIETTKGEILDAVPHLLPEIVDGLISMDFYSLYLNLSMLKTIHKHLKLPDSDLSDIENMLGNQFTPFKLPISYNELHVLSQTSKPQITMNKITTFVSKVMAAFEMKSPHFFKYFSTFNFVSTQEQLRRLDVIYLWIVKLENVCFYQNFNISLHSTC